MRPPRDAPSLRCAAAACSIPAAALGHSLAGSARTGSGRACHPVGMQVLILTNEYPPEIYGGAGVHVEYLTHELAKLVDVDVRTFGRQDETGEHLRVRGFPVAHDVSRAPARLQPLLA